MDMREFNQVTSKIGLILFLSGMAIGRIIIGYLTPRDKITQTLLILFGSSVLVYSGLYFIDIGNLTYVAIFLAGLSISALLPLMLTQASLLYHEIAGTVMGSIKVAIPLGGILIPFLMSVLVNYVGFQFSLIVFPLSLLLAFFLIYLTSPSMTNSKRSPAAE